MSDFFAAFREDLLEAAARQQDRPLAKLRRAAGRAVAAPRPQRSAALVLPRPLLAFAAVVISLVVAAGTVVSPPEAQAGVLVERVDGLYIVSLTHAENTPAQVAGALRDAGIDAEVVGVPVGPSNIGKFIGTTQSSTTREFAALHGTEEIYSGFALPEGWGGELRLFLGRHAEPGEMYQQPSDAYAVGEPLACLDLRGKTVAEARQLVAPTGADVRWRTLTEMGPPVPETNIVGDAVTFDGTTIQIFTFEPGEDPRATRTTSVPGQGCVQD